MTSPTEPASGRAAVRSSPLMLMVLVLLAEAPMHPYEMQRLMQWRGKDQVVRVQRGSLYPAVERLVRGRADRTDGDRAGRPAAGADRLSAHRRGSGHRRNLAGGMIRTVSNEFPEFPAALSFMPLLSAEEARAQLTARLLGLGKEIAAIKSIVADLGDKYQLPRLFAIEDEYRLAMLEAEHRWVSGILDDLASGELYWDTPDDPGLGGGSVRSDGGVSRHSADCPRSRNCRPDQLPR